MCKDFIYIIEEKNKAGIYDVYIKKNMLMYAFDYQTAEILLEECKDYIPSKSYRIVKFYRE